MVWPAIIIGIIVIWILWEGRQDDLYPPEMREQKALEESHRRQKIARMKKAMNDPKYYEEMKNFDPTFTVPSGSWWDTPEGKEEKSRNVKYTLVFYAFVAFWIFVVAA